MSLDIKTLTGVVPEEIDKQFVDYAYSIETLSMFGLNWRGVELLRLGYLAAQSRINELEKALTEALVGEQHAMRHHYDAMNERDAARKQADRFKEAIELIAVEDQLDTGSKGDCALIANSALSAAEQSEEEKYSAPQPHPPESEAAKEGKA